MVVGAESVNMYKTIYKCLLIVVFSFLPHKAPHPYSPFFSNLREPVALFWSIFILSKVL